MDSSDIYKCLESIANLGTEKNTYQQNLQKFLIESKCVILNLQEVEKINFTQDTQPYSDFLSDSLRCLKLNLLDNENILCSLNALYLLHHLLVTHEGLNKQKKIQSSHNLKTDVPNLQGSIPQDVYKPGVLISIQQLKVIEKATKYIMYTSVLICLDSESSLFMKMKMVKEKFAYAVNGFPMDSNCRLQFLKFNLKYLIPLFKSQLIGEPLQSHLLGEILSPILFLSFSPTAMKEFSEEVPSFRFELEYVLINFDHSGILQVIILTRTLANSMRHSWLQKCCHSLFIRRFLFKENGVSMVLKASLSIVDFQDWRKKEAVASLISSAKVPNEIEFYENVGPQIVSLIMQNEISGDIFQILGFLTFQLHQRAAKLSKRYIFLPLLKPLIMLTEDYNDMTSQVYDIAKCVSILYKLYVEMMLPSPDLGPIIELVLCPLFQVSLLPPTCYVKTNATLIIVRYLNLLEPLRCIDPLLVLCGLEYSSAICPVIPKLSLSMLSSKDGICIDPSQIDTEIDCLEKDETVGKNILDILDKLKNPSIVKEFYQKLLCYLDFTCLNHLIVPANLLLTTDDENSIKIANVRKLHMAVNLLSLISENQQLIEDLFHDFFAAAPFLESLLKIGKQSCEDEGLSVTKEALLMNCIMMISSFISDRILQKKMSYSDWQGLNKLLPTLNELHNCSSNPALLEFIDLLRTTIHTHGIAVDPSLIKSKCSLSTSIDGATQHAKSDKNSLDDISNLAYEEAMADVCSPHLPVRGHALLSFAKLLNKRDEKTLKNKKELLALFEYHLKDEDSYIYLMAVQGLVSLSNVLPDKIIPILTYEVNRGNLSCETRLKMVEVLTQVTKRLGPLLPKYKNIFINSLLTGAKDEDEFVRASCISNLGEVCKELRFSIGPIIQEIFTFIHLIVKGDKSSIVRSAGVLVINLLFQGLGKDSLKLFQGVILDIYRALKHLIRTETDPALLLQAGLAIEEINAATKEFLLPDLKMEKKIYVTELPPKF